MQQFQHNTPGMPTITNVGMQSFLSKVYVWMTAGLAITALIALFVSRSPAVLYAVYSNPILPIILLVAQLGIVFGISYLIDKINATTAIALFLVYSVLTGVTFSIILLAYTQESIVNTFFITAGMFAGFSFYGYSTKRDLTNIGSMLIMALIGILIASIVNIFMQSSALQWAISMIGVVVFVGLTAYDTQRLKEMGEQMDMNNAEQVQKYTILGALTLYLDFINLFIMLLRLIGNKEE